MNIRHPDYPRLFTYYVEEGDSWEEAGEFIVESDSELLRASQLVQDLVGNLRVLVVDGVTGERLSLLYKR